MRAFPAEWRGLKVALCHDWLTGMRGGERVLELLCEGFPDAPVYTLFHVSGAISERINRHPIHTSWLQNIPGIGRHYRVFLPFFPGAVERMRPPPVDVLISTSHCVAKGIRPAAGTPHLCYSFTPMRYAWLFQREYLGAGTARALAAAPLLAWLRRWDRRTAARVDRFVAISRHVRERIRTFYGREADVVYPPVNLARWTPGRDAPGEYDLIVSALVPYKRVDLAVRAYTKRGDSLWIAGTGTEYRRLRALAGPNVRFLGRCSDEELLSLYRRCRLLVFPGEEDFGIVPLEAMACGRPVAAFGRGGAVETIRDGVTGVFFDRQTEEALWDAVERAAAIPWDSEAIRSHAEQFGEDRFLAGFAAQVAAVRALRG